MKKYFNPSMFWLSYAFIIYFVYHLYSHVSQIIFSSDYSFIWTDLMMMIKPVIAIIILVQLIILLKAINIKGFFQSKVSSCLERISIFLLAYGLFCFLQIQFSNAPSFEFAMVIFLSTLSYSFSQGFKKASILKQENDLTI